MPGLRVARAARPLAEQVCALATWPRSAMVLWMSPNSAGQQAAGCHPFDIASDQ